MAWRVADRPLTGWERPTRSNRRGPFALDQRQLLAATVVFCESLDVRSVFHTDVSELLVQLAHRPGGPFRHALPFPAAGAGDEPARLGFGHYLQPVWRSLPT